MTLQKITIDNSVNFIEESQGTTNTRSQTPNHKEFRPRKKKFSKKLALPNPPVFEFLFAEGNFS